jgi:hypothetical protein
MAFLSKRRYKFTYVHDGAFYTDEFTLEYLFSKDRDDTEEMLFALQDVGDQVLDLKQYESMYVSAIRDNAEATKGILVRIL